MVVSLNARLESNKEEEEERKQTPRVVLSRAKCNSRQLLHRNVQGLVFKAYRLLYQSNPGLRVI